MVPFPGFIIYPLNLDGKISKASVGQRRHPGKAELRGKAGSPNYTVPSGASPLRFPDILLSPLVFKYANALETENRATILMRK